MFLQQKKSYTNTRIHLGIFQSGRTRDLDWRKSQLRSLLRLVEENEVEIAKALKTDLNKSNWEALLHELLMFKNEINETIK